MILYSHIDVGLFCGVVGAVGFLNNVDFRVNEIYKSQESTQAHYHVMIYLSVLRAE